MTAPDRRQLSLLPAVALLASCAWSTAGSTGCAVEFAQAALPQGLEETSGLAPARWSSILWTHNDSGWEPVLTAVDFHGRAHASLRLTRPDGSDLPARDLEGMARADCPEGSCLFIGDVGDNEELRTDAAVFRVVEPEHLGEAPASIPAPGSIRAAAVTLPIRFPDGPRDVEALYVLPGERIHLVTKGRNHPVTVYRYPLPVRPEERVTLEEIQRLTDETPSFAGRVTGASASDDGRIVAVRSYESLHFYRVRPSDGRLEAVAGGRVRLRSLREAQGEAITLLPDGGVVLSSEAGPGGRRGGLTVLRCPGVTGGGVGARIGSTRTPGVPKLEA